MMTLEQAAEVMALTMSHELVKEGYLESWDDDLPDRGERVFPRSSIAQQALVQEAFDVILGVGYVVMTS